MLSPLLRDYIINCVKALYWEKEGNNVRCNLCPHSCLLTENEWGFCKSRKVENGELISYSSSNVVALHVDPIEKKPLYHFYPTEPVLSVGTTGCNLKCHFCQNHEISQVYPYQLMGKEVNAEELVEASFARGVEILAATYNEPTVFYELALELGKAVSRRGGKYVWVTNGFIEEEPLKEISPYLDAVNVDVKFPSEKSYRKNTSGSLMKVLRTIELLIKRGVWVELTTLVIPTLNDNPEEWLPVWDKLLTISEDLVYHFSAYFPAYKCTIPPTPPESLRKMEEAARKAGFKFVYLGNVPKERNTLCPNCGNVVIERGPFYDVRNKLKEGGKCPFCGQPLPGRFR